MSLKHLALSLLTATALFSGSAMAAEASKVPELAGRALMWADAASEDCEVPPEIEFGTNGKITGNTACNTLMGAYTQNGYQLDLSKAATTRRMCGPKLMEVEGKFLANLKATRQFKLDGEHVQLLDDKGQVVMTLVPLQPGSCQ